MKKLFVFLLALVLVLSLAACGGGGDNEKTPSSDDKTPSSGQQQEQNTPDPDPVEDEPEEPPAPDTSEQDDTSSDAWTVESFLKLYGFNAEELKPNHFTSFEELKMADSKEPGKKGSAGSVTINVEKGKTTADDFNAWFETLYAKMTELSDDGKLYYSVAKTVEATPLSELQSGVLWADMPGGLCVITTKVDGSAMTIGISSKYDVELEQYSISITVM